MSSIKPVIKTADPFGKKEWLNLATGFGISKETPYIIYRICIFSFMLLIHFMLLYTLYLVSSDSLYTAGVLHVYADSVWLLWITISRALNDRSLMQMRDMINSGIYNYDAEELEEEQVMKLNGIENEIKRRLNKFVLICVLGTILGVVLFPLYDFVMSDPEIDLGEELLNPYLPFPIYYPFNTSTPLGFVAAFVVDMIYYFYDYSTAVVSNGIIISSTVHLKVHFDVLNYSIRNIHRRAYKLFAEKSVHEMKEVPMDELAQREDFRKCVKSCFKTNIQHHQAILRFKSVCQPYNGVALLNMFTIVTFIYAVLFFLLMQELPLTEKIKIVIAFLMEQSYALLLCYIGEEVTTESDDLFGALYSTPWIHYDKDFKKNVHIMMSNTRQPMHINAYFIDFSASLKSFSELESSAYKVMSLWRQSESIN